MKWADLGAENCSLARTVGVVGDRWTLLILRDSFLRVRRFEAFQARLGITRPVLADRLRKLVRTGILEKVAYQDRPKRYDYRLTARGLDLHPVVMSLVHFGDKHLTPDAGPPLVHRHKVCGSLFHPVMTCSVCGEPLTAGEVAVEPGPGSDPPSLSASAVSAFP